MSSGAKPARPKKAGASSKRATSPKKKTTSSPRSEATKSPDQNQVTGTAVDASGPGPAACLDATVGGATGGATGGLLLSQVQPAAFDPATGYGKLRGRIFFR